MRENDPCCASVWGVEVCSENVSVWFPDGPGRLLDRVGRHWPALTLNRGTGSWAARQLRSDNGTGAPGSQAPAGPALLLSFLNLALLQPSAPRLWLVRSWIRTSHWLCLRWPAPGCKLFLNRNLAISCCVYDHENKEPTDKWIKIRERIHYHLDTKFLQLLCL